MPARLLLLCLLFRSSWLTVEGGRGRRRHGAASPGRTGSRGRVGRRGHFPNQQSRLRVVREHRLLAIAQSGSAERQRSAVATHGKHRWPTGGPQAPTRRLRLRCHDVRGRASPAPSHERNKWSKLAAVVPLRPSHVLLRRRFRVHQHGQKGTDGGCVICSSSTLLGRVIPFGAVGGAVAGRGRRVVGRRSSGRSST
jgi:hypothetical protein